MTGLTPDRPGSGQPPRDMGDGTGRDAPRDPRGQAQSQMQAKSEGKAPDRPGPPQRAGDVARAEQAFSALLSGMAEADAPKSGPPRTDEDARRGSDMAFVVTILPGERPAAPPVPSHYDAARMEARVERVLAAVQGELSAAPTLHGGRGMSLSFPLAVPGLGIAGVTLMLSQGALDVTLAGQGPLGAAQQAALRDLAASLAQRHPNRTVRVRREEAEADPALPSAPGTPQPRVREV
ncbi:hypothetical protein [Marivita sp. GX14005]|uniref:hypothetical protein n=1 Tax=Marivita sp. GX14005 TaxID=2942276 RepID=UPI0020188228|nr:hypothetical protein [Marivita sp. GX14005]MCL3883308.1 hypothetical protein [Marivita sp. GX14005]